MVVITEQHLEQIRTPAGGYNMKSMELIGLWPLAAGWRERAISMKVSDRKWKAALKASTEKRHFYRGNTGSKV